MAEQGSCPSEKLCRGGRGVGEDQMAPWRRITDCLLWSAWDLGESSYSLQSTIVYSVHTLLQGPIVISDLSCSIRSRHRSLVKSFQLPRIVSKGLARLTRDMSQCPEILNVSTMSCAIGNGRASGEINCTDYKRERQTGLSYCLHLYWPSRCWTWHMEYMSLHSYALWPISTPESWWNCKQSCLLQPMQVNLTLILLGNALVCATPLTTLKFASNSWLLAVAAVTPFVVLFVLAKVRFSILYQLMSGP